MINDYVIPIEEYYWPTIDLQPGTCNCYVEVPSSQNDPPESDSSVLMVKFIYLYIYLDVNN